MSLASKITLSLALVSSCGVIFSVHYMQQSEREKLHVGVVKDIERQRRRKLENISILEQQQELTRKYQESLEQEPSGDVKLNTSKSNDTSHHHKLKEKDSNSSKPKIQKRDPVKPKNTSLANVYVNNQSSLRSQIEKCERLLKQEDEIIVHGLGSAVPIAINLALQLNSLHSNTLSLDVNTSTAKLVDDIEPTSEDGDYKTQVRNNSSVHIRIKQNVPVSG
ncbi:hypothetical protein M8J77_023751 [Diaphorina citri]|nr:hypothetical protein M8J77_023751 [Diaphorina citri]